MADQFEKKNESQLHSIADKSHQMHRSVTGQVPSIRDGDDNDSGEDESPQVYRGPEYQTIPKE